MGAHTLISGLMARSMMACFNARHRKKRLVNVASPTKTVTAESVLRLVGAGNPDLDAPLAPYWLDPDIANDPRREQVTA